MPRARTPAPSADYGEIVNFLAAAYRDYIAARVLLNHDLPLQGAIQASTAIEKYIKAVLACRGNRSHGHLKRAHLNAFRNYSPSLYAGINEDFLLFLQKVYAVRYPDKLPVGFNVVVATREFLAELDATALHLDRAFETQQAGQRLAAPFDRMQETRDPRLFTQNHVLAGIAKDEFVSAAPQLVYEMRVVQRAVSVDIHYIAAPAQSDGKFMREGMCLTQNTSPVAFVPLIEKEIGKEAPEGDAD